MTLKCASFFAGVGGIDLGFEYAGFKTVYANEIDPKATKTYELNFKNVKIDNRDICEVVKDIEHGIDPFDGEKIDVIFAGFPCQAFSIAGYQEGFDDKKGRGGLFFEVMKIVDYVKPDFIFLENVKNLMSHDKGKTYKIIRGALEAKKYYVDERILNSMEYGNVPQNRERIYIVAFRKELNLKKFKWPEPIKLEKTLDKVLDYNNKLDDIFYYTKERFKRFSEIEPYITKRETVYQWRRVYVRENKSNVCPTLTANMGMGGHNVPLILTDNGIRKLTPRECFDLQGFPHDYILPENMANSYLYKQAGNSVSVSVIQRIAEEVKKVL